MIYFIPRADSFRESALSELGGAAPGYRLLEEQHNLFIIEAVDADQAALNDAKFIRGCFPVYVHSEIVKGNYIESIYKQLTKMDLKIGIRIKLECLDINCKEGYSAKDIEVAIGKEMEKNGFTIDMSNPEVLAYIILMNSRCYCGYVDVANGCAVSLDTFRGRKKIISRSEFKIAEAFEVFGLEDPKIVIDIGAAPGGWSLFLARRGAAVIAVDSAELDYARIHCSGTEVEVMNANGMILEKDIIYGGILHIKCGFDDAMLALDGIRVDMITNDINTGGMEASRAALRYAGIMMDGAKLIMTVKCMRRNVGRYMNEVEGMLSKSFKIVKWKVLPHNRQEITLFAVKL